MPGGLAPFPMAASRLVPLAGFSLDGRVLSRKDYRSGREADWSPTDLALGWDGMARDEVLALLGPPDSERDGMLVYETGVSPYGIDTEALRIAFDDAGRLVTADIERR